MRSRQSKTSVKYSQIFSKYCKTLIYRGFCASFHKVGFRFSKSVFHGIFYTFVFFFRSDGFLLIRKKGV